VPRALPFAKDEATDAVGKLAFDRGQTGQRTAKLATEILVESGSGFIVPSAAQRKAILIAFVQAGYIIYGKAFDVVKTTAHFDLADPMDVGRHLDAIVIYEVKSTNKERVPQDFRHYFFSLSTAELLVAQNLGSRYRFAFVNVRTRTHIELSLTEVFARARGIYPTWSIQF
jgi:hypothetical protein